MPPLAPSAPAAEPLDDLELDGGSASDDLALDEDVGSGSESDESDDVTPEAMARIMELLGDDAAGLLEGSGDEDEESADGEDEDSEAEVEGLVDAEDVEGRSGEDGSDDELDGTERLLDDVSDTEDAVVVQMLRKASSNPSVQIKKRAVNNRVCAHSVPLAHFSGRPRSHHRCAQDRRPRLLRHTDAHLSRSACYRRCLGRPESRAGIVRGRANGSR